MFEGSREGVFVTRGKGVFVGGGGGWAAGLARPAVGSTIVTNKKVEMTVMRKMALDISCSSGHLIS